MGGDYAVPSISTTFNSNVKYLRLKYLVPLFGIKEKSESDKMTLHIYSDAIKQLLQCGEFAIISTDFLAMNDLDIPCYEEVVITLTEYDTVGHDAGYSIRVSCTDLGPVSMELKFAAFQVSGKEDNTLEISAQSIADYKKLSKAEIAKAVSYGSLKLLTAGYEYKENNAIY